MSLLKNLIKFSFLFALISLLATSVDAQADKSKRKSPPVENKGMVGDASITINYSAPSVKGRTIFGDMEPFDEVWRTGANEATTFEASKNLLVEGEQLPAGKYAMFTIPGEEKWTIIFNSEFDQWGDYNYDPSKDVLRVEVVPTALDELVEQLSITVEDSKVNISWENTSASFGIAPGAAN